MTTRQPSDETAALAAKLDAAVERLADDQVDFLRQVVRIPSQTGDEGAAQEFVAARLRADGFATDVWEPDPALLAPYAEHFTAVPDFRGRPNVVGTRPGTGGGRSLLLNAHIDTVEPGDPSQWRHDPFGGAIVDGKLFGRGACDMKGGLATHLFALAALQHAGITLRGDVVLASTISEEDGGAGALAAVLRGYRADGAVITEPTRLAVVPAQGGSLMFRLRLSGRSAHACVRDEGISAVELFARLHAGLLAYEAQRNRAIDHPLYAPIANKIPINIGTLRAGSWPSSVPEWLEAEGRAGLVPGEDLDTFRAQFRAEVERLAAAEPWLRDHPPTIEWFGGQFAPAEVPTDSPLLVNLAQAHAATTGHAPALEAVTYGADMRHFILVGDTPCVMYGAGDVRVAHHADEHIPLADLRTATKTIALAVAAWCGVADA